MFRSTRASLHVQIDIRIVWSDIEAVKGAGASAEDETVGWLMGTHGRQTRAVPGAVIAPPRPLR